MAITFGPISTRRETDPRTGEKFTRICVTLYNDGDQPEKRKVSFYLEIIPSDGAKPVAPAAHFYLCTAEENTISAQRALAHGSTKGFQKFCCDLSYEIEPKEKAFGKDQFVAVTGTASNEKEKKSPIAMDHGTEQSFTR